MLQTNQGLPLKKSFSKRKVLLHPETIRGILRFTYGSALRPMYRMQNCPQSRMGTQVLASCPGLSQELLYNPNFQRRTQSQNSNSSTLSAFHEKVKEEIRAIKSLLKNKTKETI